MKNLKVIRFLSALDSKELEEFEKFLRSPYFNSRDEVLGLFVILKKNYPEFPEAKIKKERVFKQLFPSNPYNEKKIYALGLALQKLITQFMGVNLLMGKKQLWEPVMVNYALRNHKLGKYLPRFLEEGEEELKGYPSKEAEYFYYRYLFQEQQVNQIIREKNRTDSLPLQSISDQLDYFVAFSKLEIAIPFANTVKVVDLEHNQALVAESIDLYERLPQPIPESLQLFYHLLMMLVEEDGEASFKSVKELLQKCQNSLSQQKLYQAFQYAINFCSKMIKQGHESYIKETFDLFSQMLEQDLLFYYTDAADLHFKNVVTIGIRLKKYDWVRDFINENKFAVGEGQRESITNYSYATLYFAEKAYSKAKQLLTKVKFLDPYYRLNTDALLLKIFYETGDPESLYFRCRALMLFITRNKVLSSANKEAYLNFIRFIRRISRVKFDRKRNLPKILEDFKQVEFLVERNWLKEKLKEL